jgi:hypothetical protein
MQRESIETDFGKLALLLGYDGESVAGPCFAKSVRTMAKGAGSNKSGRNMTGIPRFNAEVLSRVLAILYLSALEPLFE